MIFSSNYEYGYYTNEQPTTNQQMLQQQQIDIETCPVIASTLHRTKLSSLSKERSSLQREHNETERHILNHDWNHGSDAYYGTEMKIEELHKRIDA